MQNANKKNMSPAKYDQEFLLSSGGNDSVAVVWCGPDVLVAGWCLTPGWRVVTLLTSQ